MIVSSLHNSKLLYLYHSYIKTYFDFFMVKKNYQSTLINLAEQKARYNNNALITTIYEMFILFDYFKKALQNTNFKKFWTKILNYMVYMI